MIKEISATQVTDFRWRDVIGWRLFLLTGLSLTAYILMVAVLSSLWFSPTGKDNQYAVLMPPWVDYKAAVALADSAHGLVIDMNRNTGIALMYVNRPDAVDSLYQSGAWMVLDPEKLGASGFTGLCSSKPAISSRARIAKRITVYEPIIIDTNKLIIIRIV